MSTDWILKGTCHIYKVPFPLTEKEMNNLEKMEASPHNASPVVPATPPSVPPSLGSTPSPSTEKLIDGPLTNHVSQGEKSIPLVTGKPMAAANVKSR